MSVKNIVRVLITPKMISKRVKSVIHLIYHTFSFQFKSYLNDVRKYQYSWLNTFPMNAVLYYYFMVVSNFKHNQNLIYRGYL